MKPTRRRRISPLCHSRHACDRAHPDALSTTADRLVGGVAFAASVALGAREEPRRSRMGVAAVGSGAAAPAGRCSEARAWQYRRRGSPRGVRLSLWSTWMGAGSGVWNDVPVPADDQVGEGVSADLAVFLRKAA